MSRHFPSLAGADNLLYTHRMLEQEAMRNKGKPKTGPRSERFSTASPEPKYKPKSGGMTASLDSDSNLIWE